MSIIFIGMFALLILGVPIAYSIGLVATIGLFTEAGVPLAVAPARMFAQLDSFALLAVPLFILAGNLMDTGGISKRLIDFAYALVGRFRGGLGMVSVLSCMLFGAISGSGAAATAAIGGITVPAMKEKGYDKEFAGAIVAASGPIGIVIPPSIAMIIYAMVAGVSVGDLFLAGYVPGILIGGAMMFMVYFIAKKKGYPTGERQSIREIFRAFLRAIWAIFMVVIIVGGIFGGFFTATEAAAVSVFYALFVGVVVYRELTLKGVIQVLKLSAETTAAIMFIVAATNVLAWLMTSQQMHVLIGRAVQSVATNAFVVLILVNVVFIVLGAIMDSAPAMVLAVPILLPIAQYFGVDPVHFGIITVVNLAIGMSTPPVGVTLYVASGIAKTSLASMVKPLLPIWVVMFAILLLITYVPAISLFLGNLL